MMDIFGKDFLLNTQTAKILYHEAAEGCPIIDYHCHISPKEIWEDRKFENITQIWLGGDHYKWRLMRCAGVDEYYITGGASDKEKFLQWARVLGKAVGNPLYHWSHLELRRFFGWEGYLNENTAEEVWEFCNEKLQKPEFSARGLISMSNVKAICTTDDPIDSLEYHEQLKKDLSFKTAVLPAWRPDKIVNIEKPDYLEYLGKLENASGMKIGCINCLKKIIIARMDYFHERDCRLSDHGLDFVPYEMADDAQAADIFKKRMAGEALTAREIQQFKTYLLLFLGKEYAKRGWVMQLHYGAKRNNNPVMFEKLGPDTGYDSADNFTPSANLANFLGALEKENALPRTIIYSLNPVDNAVIVSLCGCFQSGEAKGKVQHGSAWWFNDHFDGMTDQIKTLAADGYLPGFVGMLTDSRSFLSYPRHEYFRRILCRVLGEWVEEGMYPADLETLKGIVSDISFNNANEYFRFAEK